MPKVSEAHRENRRRQILDAAIECFAHHGFQRTTMEDIIGEAGLSAGAIYSYFQSKDQIIETLADQRHEREKRIIEAALNRDEWAASLRELFRSFSSELLTASSARKERRLGIQLWAEALCNPKVLTLIRRGINQPLKLLSNAIAEAQGSGRLQRTLNPEAAARVLIAMFHGLILQQAWDERTEVAEFAKAAQAMLAAYFSPKATAHTPKTRKLRPR
ncbi:TetR/AcrR family transcriptional regulator [Candidatus Binatus sp.]|uniref:TetR/AcrR family transcriptional regulator n=1 Tax=Candidatus Binatus sp. TaxID=2811406 RepID=UPI003BE0D988